MRPPLLLLLLAGSLQAQAPAPRPLSLEEALTIALPASENVGLARAALARARGQRAEARAELFPQITGSASYNRLLKSQYSSFAKDTSTGSTTARPSSCERFFSDPTKPIGERVDSLERSLECVSALNPFGNLGSLPFGRANTYNLGLSASQTLFSGGRVRGQIRSANAGLRSAEIGLEAAEAQLTLDVVQTYFDAALADQLSGIAATALAQADSTLRDTELRRSVGNVPEFDLLRARVTRDNARASAIQSASSRDIALLRLQQLLDLPAGTPLRLTTAPDDSSLAATPSLRGLLATAGDTAADRRASVRQADEAIAVQEAQLTISRAQQLPSVSLSSAYGRVAYPKTGLPDWNQFLTNWNLAVGLTVPVFTGGRIHGDKVVAQAGLDEARLRRRQAAESAELDSRSSQEQLGSARELLNASEGTVVQAERAYQIADIRYREGISTHTELLDARLALEQARANRALAARDLQVARIRMALLPRLPLGGAASTTTSPVRSTTRPTTATQPTGTTGFGIP